MIQRTKQKLAVAVVASLSISGCLPAVRFRPSLPTSLTHCESTDRYSDTATQQAIGRVTVNSPFVRIVGESAPPTNLAELELLAAELHSELAFRGGVNLENSALVAQQPGESCGISVDHLARNPLDNVGGRQTADGETPEDNNVKTISGQIIDYNAPPATYFDDPYVTTSPAMNSPAMSSPSMQYQGSGANVRSNFEVAVIVNDFTPYRPMQLAATFIVRDLSTGQEINRIHRVWRGIPHEPEFEADRKKRNADLRHPATRQRLEHTALPDISPRHLIKRAATEVADSLYQSILKPHPATSGQYSSAPQEFHQPQ